MSETVLVTGISGYIGVHCAAAALRAGYRVRGSVRSLSKEQAVRDALVGAAVDTDKLEFVELDLTVDEGWQAAAEGCTYVLHVASPFVIANPKDENEMLEPAVQGTLRVLRAAAGAGVARVVLTSSALAMFGSMKKGTFGPQDWTDVHDPKLSTYTKSKTLAERAAWAFIGEQTGDSPMELVVINPGGVFGPPLGSNISGQSMAMLDQMLLGKVPMVPNAAFPMVDVRDVAMLHVRAMTLQEARGRRFIAAHREPFGFAQMAKTLNDHGHPGPSTRVAPDFLLRMLSLFDREAKGMIGFLGMEMHADNSETCALFDWTPIPLEQSLRESAAAVQALQQSR
jgi:dihydroflavonol-4-reductase